MTDLHRERTPPTERKHLSDLPVSELQDAAVKAERYAGPDSDPAKMARRALQVAERRERG